MFGFFGKKEMATIAAPLSGRAIPITEAPDPVFADKILGDGIATAPEDHSFYPAVDGKTIGAVVDALRNAD